MERFARFLGSEESFVRPLPTAPERRRDLQLALAWALVGMLGVELLRATGTFGDLRVPVLGEHLLVVSAAALLAWRRRYPMLVASLGSVHMMLTGMLAPPVMASLPMQVLYFFAIYTGVAYGRDRRALAMVVTGIVALMLGWVAWQFALGSGMSQVREWIGETPTQEGLLPAFTAAVAYTGLVNVIYFGGAVLLGQVAWDGARRTAQVIEQAATIHEQAGRLRDQAVVAERLRIARELHDVVAHHVSVMGVQAAAARRVLDSEPDAAREALSAVERSSREAVGQMRDLLGTLRTVEPEDRLEGSERLLGPGVPEGLGGGSGREPQPGLGCLPELVEEARDAGREVELSVVEEYPGAAAAVPAPLQLTAYRVVQEALTNVRRHSTARHVGVTVRAGRTLEVEVVDDGSPRRGTEGTGLGLRGLRERAHLLGGSAETGPRATGGFQVRVVLPVPEAVRR
ncbi:sensor histidine kinase [Ornithinicoccus halotolerans]|uniref:sensor histidine kinase n=1 Tax=Ornithinicoccus halotolerans TaxID=1748220 RepID=UPI001295F5DD|nr:histidine kinase [Ornithinicoccus halotolerans]